VGVQVAVSELVGGLHPVEEMEVEVVAAGTAVEDEGKDGDAGGEWDQEIGEPVALHSLRVSQWVLLSCFCPVGLLTAFVLPDGLPAREAVIS